MTPAHLVLADGTTFPGHAIGASGTTVGEAVFTTGMTGYQEVLTDPSFCGQLVTMTAPQIGNTGTTLEDDEAAQPHLAGFVVHELSSVASNWRSNQDLDAYLRERGVVGIAGVDTRALTRHIRDAGAQQGAIGTDPVEALRTAAKDAPPMAGQDLTGRVSTKEPYTWDERSGEWAVTEGQAQQHVVAIDYGIKRNILRCFADIGCRVTVLPASSSAEEVLAHAPDGVFLSNGPGDPAAVDNAIETARALLGKTPLFGICLGHQILALALGAKTFKLKFGHRGLNHPVHDLTTGKVEITTQNHGFAVELESLPETVRATHVHLNDGTCQGIEHPETGAFGVQFHPEAGAGPHDSRYLFDRFLQRMAG
ncbi:MAG: glutamine-hydrolyzing carbamoyl-phosphate synthase small subunit [Sandaracinaceae bacterium]